MVSKVPSKFEILLNNKPQEALGWHEVSHLGYEDLEKLGSPPICIGKDDREGFENIYYFEFGPGNVDELIITEDGTLYHPLDPNKTYAGKVLKW